MKTAYDAAYFEQLYTQNKGDPWQYEQRWYEQRKRDISLAVLPKPQFTQALEIGCSNGVLSTALAKRCTHLLCLDANDIAVTQAKMRLPASVTVKQAIVPEALPQQRFDLIVISEILYYLSEQHLLELMTWLNQSLQPEGCILACHWKYPIDHFELNGLLVHQQLKQYLTTAHYLSVHDHDFELDLWYNTAHSLAAQEGLR